MDQHHIGLVGGEDGEVAIFVLSDDEPQDPLCHLACRYRGKEVAVAAADFFVALGLIRQALWVDGLMPHCYGASLDVMPSPMARRMGEALKAYRLVMGQSAKTSDLVDIFASGPDVVPATVSDQEAFYDRWLRSLGS